MGGPEIRERDGKEGALTEDTILLKSRILAEGTGLGEGDPLILLAESRALDHVWELLHNPVAPAIPGCLEGMLPLQGIHRELCEIREVMKRYAAWDLEASPESRGILPGYLKTLQSNLRHLIWRMGMTLEGDLSPQKKSIGEFSGAFDDLLRCMDRALRGLREQEAEPPAMTDPRREADRRNPAADTPPERDACRVAGYDDLTGALNRESFIFRALVELYAAFAQGKRCCLAIVDLDRFEDFNDRYGRPAGDKALGHAAKIIGAQLRKTDFMGRWGGETFALFFQGMDFDACRVVYERILQTLTFTPLNLGENPAYITASIGVTVADPDEFDINAEDFRFLTDGTEILEKLAGRAEEALYEARRIGRTRMVSFHEQITITNKYGVKLNYQFL